MYAPPHRGNSKQGVPGYGDDIAGIHSTSPFWSMVHNCSYMSSDFSLLNIPLASPFGFQLQAVFYMDAFYIR